MRTVSFRVPEELSDRMQEEDDVNWSAVLRRLLEGELRNREVQNMAHAVATSERLSGAIDSREVAETNTAETVRAFRDSRYGEDGS